MKTCPVCQLKYQDDMFFCLEDGAKLVSGSDAEKITERVTEEYAAPTIARPAEEQVTVAAMPQGARTEPQFREPQRYESKRSRGNGFLVLLGLLLIGGIAVLGAGVVGLWYFGSLRNNVDRTQTGNPEQPTETPRTLPDNTGDPGLIGVTNSDNGQSPSELQASPTPISSPAKPTPSPTKDEKTKPEPTPKETPTEEPGYPTPTPTNRPPKTISGGVLNGKATNLVRPPYPPAARAARASGAVSVQVLIDESGNVVSASAVSGHPLLRAASVGAARASKFQPTKLSGQAVKVSGIIVYNFVAP